MQHTTEEVKFVAITTETKIKLRENCYSEDEEHESERKQKVKRRKSIYKGKVLGGKRKTFEIEGPKQGSRVDKKKGGNEEKEMKFITR